jgi:hypothetical protein
VWRRGDVAPPFLISLLHGREWQIQMLAALRPSKQAPRVTAREDPRKYLGPMEKSKIPCPCQKSNLDSSVYQTSVSESKALGTTASAHCCRLAIGGFCMGLRQQELHIHYSSSLLQNWARHCSLFIPCPSLFHSSGEIWMKCVLEEQTHFAVTTWKRQGKQEVGGQWLGEMGGQQIKQKGRYIYCIALPASSFLSRKLFAVHCLVAVWGHLTLRTSIGRNFVHVVCAPVGLIPSPPHFPGPPLHNSCCFHVAVRRSSCPPLRYVTFPCICSCTLFRMIWNVTDRWNLPMINSWLCSSQG